MGHEKLIDIFDLNLAAPQFSAYTMDLHKAACVLSSHRGRVKIHELHDVLRNCPNMCHRQHLERKNRLFSGACESRHNTKLKTTH